MKTPVYLLALGLLPCSALQGALIVQTQQDPSNSQLWNNSVVWGGNAVTAGNTYQTALTGTSPNPGGTSFTVNGTVWNIRNNIRDTAGGAPASTTFAGDQLVLSADTRLLMKGRFDVTSTANILMEDDSHIILAPDGNGVANLAGNLTVADSALTAIGVQPNGGNTLNVTSTIAGGAGSTLQLVLHGGSTNQLNVEGDYSGFAGTFYLATSTSPTGAGSSFSFGPGTAPLATFHLTTNPNFTFDLDSDIAFGSVILGESTVLAPGTYDYDALSGLGFGSAFISNGGSITVVPEPSIAALGGAGMLCLLRSRRRGSK